MSAAATQPLYGLHLTRLDLLTILDALSQRIAVEEALAVKYGREPKACCKTERDLVFMIREMLV